MKRLKIGYLSSEDPADKKVWSGTHHSIFKCLKSLGQVVVLGPYQPKTRLLLGKILNQVALKLSGKRFDYRHSFLLAKGYAGYFNKQIRKFELDVIVAPAASCELAFINTSLPVIYITDGTFNGCLNYHKALTNLLKFNIWQGNTIEKEALHKSKTVIVSSEWAARSVHTDYGVSNSKIRVLPFGANFDQIPVVSGLDFKAPVHWKLLFVGVYWESKGGPIAYAAFRSLLEKGFDVSFTIVGCNPPPELDLRGIQVIPFIDKNSTEGQKQLSEIYAQHHLLILPTRFDCSPIVINEASAFGIPSLVANSGGVAGHLKEGENGFLIDYEDKGKAYADKITELITTPEKYVSLRRTTRNLYESQLNWEHYTEALRQLMPS